MVGNESESWQRITRPFDLHGRYERWLRLAATKPRKRNKLMAILTPSNGPLQAIPETREREFRCEIFHESKQMCVGHTLASHVRRGGEGEGREVY